MLIIVNYIILFLLSLHLHWICLIPLQRCFVFGRVISGLDLATWQQFFWSKFHTIVQEDFHPTNRREIFRCWNFEVVNWSSPIQVKPVRNSIKYQREHTSSLTVPLSSFCTDIVYRVESKQIKLTNINDRNKIVLRSFQFFSKRLLNEFFFSLSTTAIPRQLSIENIQNPLIPLFNVIRLQKKQASELWDWQKPLVVTGLTTPKQKDREKITSDKSSVQEKFLKEEER